MFAVTVTVGSVADQQAACSCSSWLGLMGRLPSADGSGAAKTLGPFLDLDYRDVGQSL